MFDERLENRLEELANLEPGWIDGGYRNPELKFGEAIPKETIDWARECIVNHMRPYLYPMPDGRIQIEYAKIGDVDLSIEVDGKDKSMHIHALNHKTGSSFCQDVKQVDGKFVVLNKDEV